MSLTVILTHTLLFPVPCGYTLHHHRHRSCPTSRMGYQGPFEHPLEDIKIPHIFYIVFLLTQHEVISPQGIDVT